MAYHLNSSQSQNDSDERFTSHRSYSLPPGSTGTCDAVKLLTEVLLQEPPLMRSCDHHLGGAGGVTRIMSQSGHRLTNRTSRQMHKPRWTKRSPYDLWTLDHLELSQAHHNICLEGPGPKP